MVLSADVNPAATNRLDQSQVFELLISRTHRVCVELEHPRKGSRARQALAGAQLPAHNREQKLSRELIAERDFSGPSKPDLHSLIRAAEVNVHSLQPSTNKDTLTRHRTARLSGAAFVILPT